MQLNSIENTIKELNAMDNGAYITEFNKETGRCKAKCSNCGKTQERLYRKDIYKKKVCKNCSLHHLRGVSVKGNVVPWTHRLETIANAMQQRCENKKAKHYSYYGGKGVLICKEWREDRNEFYKWSLANGYTDDLTLDRIDHNGNYEPANCRWVTKTIQARNQKKIRKNNTSGYRGVSRAVNSPRWRTRIKVDNKEFGLGVYDYPWTAAYAYDAYIIKHNLEHTTNFLH